MDSRDELAYQTLGRIQAVLEMVDSPKIFQVTPEKGIELIRAAMNDFQEGRAHRG